ncbi:HesA/MoeB/ThiF family protein [Phaeovulum sp. NW3]|uniref:HesA/MoeB/ThiF family protein n=1 Tax=Phaeovulum sp. NW3 TaxID=2934933 RepID=UPI0020226064|nr:HesA/MoeB/ThiF family protein [Phaeovulum sp. NW3]MCL7464453.1 HesA/MoeB/ThiF family protein [Phaeovulum sp. NW3]
MIGLLGFAAIWALAVWKRPPRWQPWALAGVWWLAILWAHAPWVGSPPLARLTGGEFRAWLVFGVILAVVGLYRLVLAAVKARARPAAPQVAAAPKASFSAAELDRYARHIMLREIGGPGQKRLKGAKVLVVGAGGLGSPVLLYLAAAGVGTVGVIDDDVVSNSNLQRQVIHTDARIGMPKVFSAELQMKALNPYIEVRPYNRRLSEADAPALFAEYDLILDGTDNFATRYMVNAAAVAAGKPLIAGAIAQWEGQLSVYDPARGAPCFACVFPEAPAPGLAPSCAEAGVVGALPGVVGAMMATEAIKEITGAGQGLRGRLLIHDALWGESRQIAVKPRPDCAVCGAKS